MLLLFLPSTINPTASSWPILMAIQSSVLYLHTPRHAYIWRLPLLQKRKVLPRSKLAHTSNSSSHNHHGHRWLKRPYRQRFAWDKSKNYGCRLLLREHQRQWAANDRILWSNWPSHSSLLFPEPEGSTVHLYWP